MKGSSNRRIWQPYLLIRSMSWPRCSCIKCTRATIPISMARSARKIQEDQVKVRTISIRHFSKYRISLKQLKMAIKTQDPVMGLAVVEAARGGQESQKIPKAQVEEWPQVTMTLRKEAKLTRWCSQTAIINRFSVIWTSLSNQRTKWYKRTRTVSL